MPGSRLAAFPLAVALSGLGLALAGCGPSSSASAGSGSPAASATTATSGPAAATTSAAPAPAAASGKPSCPTAAVITAAAGTAYPTPAVKTTDGVLNCTYEGNATILNITFSTAGGPASDLSQLVGSQASAQGGGKFSPVSGIGDAAFTFTVKPATNPPTTALIVQSGSRLINIIGVGNVGQIKAIARAAIAS